MTPKEIKKDVEVKTQEMRASPEGNILKPGVRQINVAEMFEHQHRAEVIKSSDFGRENMAEFENISSAL